MLIISNADSEAPRAVWRPPPGHTRTANPIAELSAESSRPMGASTR